MSVENPPYPGFIQVPFRGYHANKGWYTYYKREDFPGEVKHWREAEAPGWFLSDDDYVVYVREVRYITEVRYKTRHTRVRRKVKFELSHRYPHGKAKYMFFQHLENRSGSRFYPIKWWEALTKRRPQLKYTIALLMIAGRLPKDRKRFNRAEYQIIYMLAEKYLGNKNSWRAIRSYIMHDEVRKMTQEEMDKELKKRGIDVEKVFSLMKSAENMALTHVDKMGNVGNPTAVLAVADRYAGLIGMNGKKQLPSSSDHEQLPGAEHTLDKILEAPDRQVEDAKFEELPDNQ